MTKPPPDAVSPAIGPIPAIHVPAAASPASLLWRAAARVVRHLPAAPIAGWRVPDGLPGTDPERRDYASFADFADPDGNTWVLQEIGYRRS